MANRRVPKEQIIKEIIHCGQDPLYFINQYAKIQHPVKGLIPFATYGYQDDVIKAYLDNRFNIVLKARQLGLTTITAAYVAWMILLHRDKNVLIVATKQDTAKNMIRTIRNIFKYLPKWIKDVAPMTVDNRHSIELDNGSRVQAVATSSDVGRSEAVSLLVVDEAAHIERFDEIWLGLWPTLSCLTGDTRVVTNRGIKKIKDFCKGREVGEYFEVEGLETWGLNGELEKVSHGYVSPESKTLKIKTLKGLEVEVTEKHPLYKLASSGGEMMKAQQLQVGDHLRVDAGMNVWGTESILGGESFGSTVEKHFAYMIGGFIAEGWITNNDTLIEISNQDDEFRNFYLENPIVKPFTAKNNDKCRMRCSSVELIGVFKDVGINPEWKCDTKRVPDRIWSTKPEVVAKFLQGYFDGDGSVTTRGIIGSSTSEKLLQDIQQLLLNFGIVSNINKTKIDKESKYGRIMPSGQALSSLLDAYTLCVPRSFFGKFANEIGFGISRKQTYLLELADLYSSDTRKQFKIPLSVVRPKILEVLEATGKTQRWFRDNGLRTDKIKKGKKINSQWVRTLRHLIINNDLPAGGFRNMEFLKEMTDSCFWDEIISITPSTSKTYDFTVPGTHAFLQNGIMGSNTGGSACVLSTPCGTGNWFHDCYVQAKNNENNFNCKLGNYINPGNPEESYDDRLMWWTHPDHDEVWFDRETRGKSPRDVAQEYLCSFNASGQTFLDPDCLNRIVYAAKPPLETFHSDRNVWIWERPAKEGIYLIPCDVSRGDALDYSAFHVLRIDVHPIVQVAEYKSKIRPDQLGILLMQVSSFYNNATIAPENNSGWSGPTILKIEEAQYPHLYYSKKSKSKSKDEYAADPFYAMGRNDYLPGYAVTSANRYPMLAKLEQYVRMGDIVLHSERLTEEFKTFIIKSTLRGERPEAQRGYHDDLVMALAGGLWVREESYMYTYRSDEMAQAMLAGMSTSNTPTSAYKDMNQHAAAMEERSKVREYVDQQNKMVMANGEEIDLSWLLTSG